MTKRISKYSIIFLVWVFLFPIAYQSVHSIRHHLIQKSDSNRRNLSETTFDTFNHNHCPVCDYEFPINDLPSNPNAAAKPLTIVECYFDYYTLNYHPGVIYTTAPRGPPSC